MSLYRFALPAAVAFALPAPAALAAQETRPAAADSAPTQRRGWLVGVSVGVPGSEGETATELLTIGVQWTQLRPGRPGADFALGTIPRLLSTGVLAVGARAGVAVPLALAPSLLLLPSAGASVLGGAGGVGAVGTAGLNVGVAAVVLPARTVGVRTGVTWHRFEAARGGLWLLEVGLVGGARRR